MMNKVLNISNDSKLELKKVIGKCISILGIRGSGKSNTGAVIAEELLNTNYPMTIVDIDGEYWGLKERYELLVVGKSENADIQVNVEHARQIAAISIEKSIPVILDMSDFLYEETYEFLLNYMDELWKLAGKFRRPYEIVLEEAHEWIPQGIKNDLKEVITRIALRGRKRGLGIIILSQRSAKVEKDVLTQAEILFLHKVVHPTDMKVYKEILPLESKEVTKTISELNVGQCLLFFGNKIKRVQIREQQTYHAGFTPSLETVEIPRLREVSEDILNSVNKLTKSKKKEKTKIERLESKIHKLEAEIVEKDKYIQKVEDDIETVSRLKIEVKQPSIAKISKAVIAQLVTTGVIPQKEEPDVLYEDMIYEDLPNYVKEHINRILKKIEGIHKSNKEMLSYLINRYPLSYSFSEIAEWIGYSESTLQAHVPIVLLNIGIITRVRTNKGFKYSSNLETFVKEQFEVYFSESTDENLELIKEYLKEQLQFSKDEKDKDLS